jgi:hypothetical protein
VVAAPVGFGPGIDCAGEERQRLWAAVPSSGWGGGAGLPALACPRLSDSGENLVVTPDGCIVPGRTDRLVVVRNIRLDSIGSCLRGKEYERKKWKHCWGWCFVFGPPRIYASRHSRLALQVLEADSNHLHRIPASRKRRWKWNPVLGCITGTPCSWGINTGTWPPGWGSLESETVKCGHQSCSTRI